MKRIVSILALVLGLTAVFAQPGSAQQVSVIMQMEDGNGDMKLAVFDKPEQDGHHYYLCVGSMGHGDDFIQVHLDPVTQLFLLLGTTLDEAQATLESFIALAGQKHGTTQEALGVFAVGMPSNGQPETILLTARRYFITRKMECSVQHDGAFRAAYVTRFDLKSALSAVKMHHRMHPDL